MGANLVWIDLEMTGLDPEKMVIIEIASIVTDYELNIIAEGPNIAINYPEGILNGIDEWSRTHHTASGLLERVRASGYDCLQAERETIEFLQQYCRKDESPLAGNSIWQDRRFLARHMPELEGFFHYRIVDVSSIKELVRRWYPSLPPYEKKKSHMALEDIYESVNELRYYKERVFK
ncbi:MAG: oligoribonuclease [Deltaproteobacteria bacterium]|nr:oligoribonuclease [Deltaproteobacteria bacterium]